MHQLAYYYSSPSDIIGLIQWLIVLVVMLGLLGLVVWGAVAIWKSIRRS